MKNEGQIWVLFIVLWVVVFFILKYFSEGAMLIYVGVSIILIGFVFVGAGIALT